MTCWTILGSMWSWLIFEAIRDQGIYIVLDYVIPVGLIENDSFNAVKVRFASNLVLNSWGDQKKKHYLLNSTLTQSHQIFVEKYRSKITFFLLKKRNGVKSLELNIFVYVVELCKMIIYLIWSSTFRFQSLSKLGLAV